MSTAMDDDDLQEGLAHGLYGLVHASMKPGLGQDLATHAGKNPNPDYVTVSHYAGEDGNPVGHSGVSVNGGPSYGLDPAFGVLGMLPVPTPGLVEPIATNRKVLGQQRIPVTSEQARSIQRYFIDHAEPLTYIRDFRNCSTLAADALRQAGVQAPGYPMSVTPKSLQAGLQWTYDSPGHNLVSTRPTLPKY